MAEITVGNPDVGAIVSQLMPMFQTLMNLAITFMMFKMLFGMMERMVG